jgi:1-acyl-sn-glycerol-3-phosphate acyltransferase
VATLRFLVALVVGTVSLGLLTIVAALLRVRRRPGGVYDSAGRWWGRLILRSAGIPVRVEGKEHLSLTEPQVIVSNHASFFDILALLGYLPVPVKFVAKRELFRIPIFGQALRAIGHVRLYRTHLKEAFEAYEHAARQVREGRLNMLVFPEGTRTRTGELLPFKKGSFVLAIAAGAPVIPCYVANTFGIQPKGSVRVRPRPISILLGSPIPVNGMSIEDRDALAARVREEIEALKARAERDAERK